MKTVALISGGKDSCFNMMQCVAEGHEIVALANLKPKQSDEIDSYMYQSVGHQAIDQYAEAMDLPLYRREIQGASKSTGRDYVKTEDDEVEDLYELLKMVKKDVEIEAVAVGAILSNYQRVRVENVCSRLGLTPLSYLWRRDQTELLDEMIQCHLEAILIKVAALGLTPKAHLGKTLQQMQTYLQEKSVTYGLNVCGEGGEFETFTLDCPLFRKRIVLDESVTVIHSDDPFAPVGYLNLVNTHLEDKPETNDKSSYDLVKDLPLKRSKDLQQELSLVEITEVTPVIETCRSTDKWSGELSPSIRRSGDHIWITGVMSCCHSNTDILTLTQRAMDQLSQILVTEGPDWSMSSLVLVHLYVNNMADFHLINSVYKTHFGLNPAARICVQADLPENVALQIDCYGNRNLDNRETMHVQGLSHWAPANIGPYSQCVMAADRLFVAGQIPMVPANLSIIPGGIHPQARLSLRHAARILEAMVTGCSIENVVTCICYITSRSFVQIAQEEYESIRGDSCCPCIPQFVVVPSLPKAALIEWEVTAVRKSPAQCQDFLSSQKLEGIECCLKCVYVNNDEEAEEDEVQPDRNLLSLCGSMACSDRSPGQPIDVTAVSQLIDQCLDEICQTCQQERSHLPPLRIFYPHLMFKYQDLYIALKNKNLFFALVPVTQLETDMHLITISA